MVLPVMRLTIRLSKPSCGTGRSRPDGCGRGAATARNSRKRAAAGCRKRRVPFLERVFYFLFLALPVVTLAQTVYARVFSRSVVAAASEQPNLVYGTDREPVETLVYGARRAFVVPFPVHNKRPIERLIQCESGGRNISKPDSDGITSDGILQFHRGPFDTMDGGTWEDFSRQSGITGSPRNPADAIRMTDWAISHGLGPHWTCYRKLNLSPTP